MLNGLVPDEEAPNRYIWRNTMEEGYIPVRGF
jgi:hypothetical protein